MTLDELKQICLDKHIPIVRDKTLELIKQIIIKNDYHSILEIGTAYGYSSVCFSQIKCVDQIVSIEKLQSNYLIANQFANNKLKFICTDAFEYEPNQKFDFIFIDGPKSHQDILLNKYLQYLNPNGTIVIDNMYLRKFENKSNLTKNQKSLINKVNSFREWLLNRKDLKVELLEFDDGICVVRRE